MSIHDWLGGARKRMLGRRLGITAALCLLAPAAAPAQTAQTEDPVQALRQEIEALRQEYGERLADLEARLARLEGTGEAQASGQEDDELAALRAAAEETTGSSAEAPDVTPESLETSVAGSERNLSQLNPEISVTGDVVGFYTDHAGEDREDFDAREFELNFQSALDPFSITKWTLAFSPEEGVDIEEGYISYTNLPGGLGLTAGKFRQNFGALNRWHLHALPQLDYPLAIQTYFGDEGLAQTGIRADWLLPHPWASANEVTLEVTDGESDAFGGESFENLVGLAHLKNYWDIGEAVYTELGLSGIAGNDSQILGTDFTFHWQPPSQAKYKEITWRTEVLRSDRDDAEGIGHQAWGGYSYIESLLGQNLYAGVRYDRVEDPLDPEHVTWGVFPNLTWWQSEYVRLRGEYGFVKDDLTGGDENRFSLQLTWAAGPHKHEIY
ncbi:MAG TPA: hypothetical protein VNM67_06835 [Thermoanaerobaculia bacterium]|jgi:hypothetical protein|nr:hypothetical protein [Thermoanaerobaculia bacterium]